MTVTKIADGRGKKKHIHIDDEYAFTLNEDFLFMTSLSVGAELTQDEVDKIKSDYDAFCAKHRAMDLLSRRSHSARELEGKLMRRTNKENARSAVQKMQELGLIDDESYARTYAEELWSRKWFARSRVRRELLSKGVDGEIADNVVDQLDGDERERLRTLIEKKYLSRMSDEKGRNSLFSLLVRLGYGYSDIRGVMNEFKDIEFYED
jgi:regulatory protein